MKQGKSWDEIAAGLTEQAKERRDFLAPAETMGMEFAHGTPFLLLDRRRPETALAVGETAHQQLAEALEIPRPYYERLRDRAPALYVANVEHWLCSSSRIHLVRTLNGTARAFLSDRYRPLDNDALAQAVIPILSERGFEIESAEVTNSRIFIKAVTSRIEDAVREGDIVRMAVSISNSEIGAGALRIDPMLYFLACTNGLIIQEDRLRKLHVGRNHGDIEGAREFFRDETREADDFVFWLKVRDAIRGILTPERFRMQLARLRSAATDEIRSEPSRVVEVAAKRFNLTTEEQAATLRHFLAGHAGRDELTRYGLAQAVSRASQDVKSYERATELEQLSGRIIELSPTQWRPLAEARAA
jgi:hypothetical protein